MRQDYRPLPAAAHEEKIEAHEEEGGEGEPAAAWREQKELQRAGRGAWEVAAGVWALKLLAAEVVRVLGVTFCEETLEARGRQRQQRGALGAEQGAGQGQGVIRGRRLMVIDVK